MRHHTPTDDQYNDALIDVTRAQHATIMAALKQGAELNTAAMVEALSEYLADPQAGAALIESTANGVNALQKVLNDLVWTEAEERARAELARMERERAVNDAMDRADRALEQVLV